MVVPEVDRFDFDRPLGGTWKNVCGGYDRINWETLMYSNKVRNLQTQWQLVVVGAKLHLPDNSKSFISCFMFILTQCVFKIHAVTYFLQLFIQTLYTNLATKQIVLDGQRDVEVYVVSAQNRTNFSHMLSCWPVSIGNVSSSLFYIQPRIIPQYIKSLINSRLKNRKSWLVLFSSRLFVC